VSGWAGQAFAGPRRPRVPECTWCGTREHKSDACPDREKAAARRERIAERQAQPCEPRERR
jgi:hypothetical protein